MIAGEYAVLSGAWSLVTAVPRRAVATLYRLPADGDGSEAAEHGSPQSATLSREALLARTLAERALGAVTGTMALDASALRKDGRKLGLGSSAALASAAAAVVFDAHGHDPSAPSTRTRVLEVALEAHRAVSPRGSGADVAAAVLGGTVGWRREGESHERCVVDWPEDVAMRVVWTGAEARTSDLVALVEALADRAPERHGAAIDRIASAASALIDALHARDASGVVRAAREHAEAMAALGEAAGAPIVEERLSAIARLAAEHGGAAKPSGAGGGDVALGFFTDEGAAAAFAGACAARGFDILSLPPGAEGVRAEP
jgi:phosphomevalonate kinase